MSSVDSYLSVERSHMSTEAEYLNIEDSYAST